MPNEFPHYEHPVLRLRNRGEALFWSEEIRAIRSLYAVNGLSMAYIAREIGVSYVTVMKICRRQSYQKVDGEELGERFFASGDALSWRAWMMRLKKEKDEGLDAQTRKERRMEEERTKHEQAKRV